jgi:hypothetical protein
LLPAVWRAVEAVFVLDRVELHRADHFAALLEALRFDELRPRNVDADVRRVAREQPTPVEHRSGHV